MNDAPDTPRTALDEALAPTPAEDAGSADEGVDLGPWLRLSAVHHHVETVVVGAVDASSAFRGRRSWWRGAWLGVVRRAGCV